MRFLQLLPRVVFGLFLLATVYVMSAAFQPTQQTFRFVQEDHPVDRWEDGKDRWAYYSIGRDTAAKVAEEARQELLPMGFVEDDTKRPWYRFARGNEEIVVCNHHEFAVNGSPSGSKLVMQKPSTIVPAPTSAWPSVLVKNGPGTAGSLVSFKIKKLIHGW